MKYIKLEDIKNIDNPLLVDVRIPSEYNNSHINNFINIPSSNILTILGKYPKNTNIVLYCTHGYQSSISARMLNSIGYNNLYILKK